METLKNSTTIEVWGLVWKVFENISLTYDLVSSQNVTSTNPEENYPFDTAIKLGILTGFLIIFISDFRITTPKFQFDSCLELKLKTMMTMIMNIISFLLLAPVVLPFLTILLIYRKIVEIVLKFQLGNDFAGLLVGTDCVWAIEKSTALSVINVLAILEKSETSINDNFMIEFRTLIKDRLISSNFDKLNWLREKKYGYFYWRRDDEIRIEERVRWIDENNEHESCDGTCSDINGDFLKTILTNVTNKPLPKQHSVSWEILVCRTCDKLSSRCIQKIKEGLIKHDDKITEGKTTFPVLFRVHHTIGDGVALLRLLLESIADPECIKIDNLHAKLTSPNVISKAMENVKESKLEIRVPILRENSSMLATFREENQILYYGNDLLSASMPFTARTPLDTLVKSIFNYIEDKCKIFIDLDIEDMKTNVIKMLFNTLETLRVHYIVKLQRELIKLGNFLAVLLSIPIFLIQQAMRSMDNSALHGPSLNGKKILSFWMESDLTSPQNNLMSKIRDIKNASGTRFGDVILAALSVNLHRYFLKIGEESPNEMTVVIPARMIIPSQNLNLQNEFSVGLEKLCIAEVNDETIGKNLNENSRLWERLIDVSRSSDQLRNGPDYFINFWVMKWLSAALPECLLEPALESHSTMIFSNLPGPQEVKILGYQLRNIGFWIPHRGSTGISCSLLTYGGKVHFSLVADVSVMKSSKLLDEILYDTVKDIEKLHKDIALLSCFAANLRNINSAAMDTGFGVP